MPISGKKVLNLSAINCGLLLALLFILILSICGLCGLMLAASVTKTKRRNAEKLPKTLTPLGSPSALFLFCKHVVVLYGTSVYVKASDFFPCIKKLWLA
jgi:hypothetical protein